MLPGARSRPRGSDPQHENIGPALCILFLANQPCFRARAKFQKAVGYPRRLNMFGPQKVLVKSQVQVL
jgi:hypothetical protein